MALVVTGGCWSSIDGLQTLNASDFDGATLYDVHFYDPHNFTHQSAAWASPPLPFIAGLSYPASAGSIEATVASSKKFVEQFAVPRRTPSVENEEKRLSLLRNYYEKEKPDRRFIKKRMMQITSWSEDNKVPNKRIVIGEFGAIRWPKELDDGSRERWLQDVRETIESQGFSWALWDYDRVFGIVMDYTERRLDEDVIKALSLKP